MLTIKNLFRWTSTTIQSTFVEIIYKSFFGERKYKQEFIKILNLEYLITLDMKLLPKMSTGRTTTVIHIIVDPKYIE